MLLCYVSLGRRKQNLLTANNDRTAQDEKLEAYSWLMASACATNISYLLNRTNYAKMLCATLNLNSVVRFFFNSLPIAGSRTACAACSSPTGVFRHIFLSFIATGESSDWATVTKTRN